jgi:SSS family solute:Na+ symporter
MIGELYGSRLLAVMVASIYLFAMVPYLAAQIQGLKVIFNYGGFGELEALIISSIMVYAWIVLAGMWSVAVTDLYQGLLMFTCGLSYFLWMIFYYVPSSGVSYSDIYKALSNSNYLGLTSFWSLGVFLAYTIPWVFFAVTNPQVVVRLYLPRDYKSYRNTVSLFFIYGFIYTIIVVVIGLTAAGLSKIGLIPGNMQWDTVTPYLLNLMPPLLGSIIGVSIVAAAVSTANSIVLAVSGSVLSTLSESSSLLAARILDALLVLSAAIVALTNVGFIVDLSVLTSVILLPLAPITILAVYKHGVFKKHVKTSAILSLLAGTGLATYYAVELGPRRAFRESINGLPLSLWVLLVSTLILVTGYMVDKYVNRHHLSR